MEHDVAAVRIVGIRAGERDVFRHIGLVLRSRGDSHGRHWRRRYGHLDQLVAGIVREIVLGALVVGDPQVDVIDPRRVVDGVRGRARRVECAVVVEVPFVQRDGAPVGIVRAVVLNVHVFPDRNNRSGCHAFGDRVEVLGSDALLDLERPGLRIEDHHSYPAAPELEPDTHPRVINAVGECRLYDPVIEQAQAAHRYGDIGPDILGRVSQLVVEHVDLGRDDGLVLDLELDLVLDVHPVIHELAGFISGKVGRNRERFVRVADAHVDELQPGQVDHRLGFASDLALTQSAELGRKVVDPIVPSVLIDEHRAPRKCFPVI